MNFLALSFDGFLLCFLLGSHATKQAASFRLLLLVALSDAFGTLEAGRGAFGALTFLSGSVALGIALGLLRRDRWLLLVLPILMGFDNLLAPQAHSSTLVAGASSFVLGAFGLLTARVVDFRRPYELLASLVIDFAPRRSPP
jgi:hypothetical protein